MTALSCFKAYDIRGEVGVNLTADVAYRIGRAYVSHLKSTKVAVGGDNRLSTPELKAALIQGLTDQGADVLDLGLTGTEEIYFATFHLEPEGVDGGIEITASHNPKSYNGMKLVAKGAVPVSGDSGLNAIKALAEENQFAHPVNQGIVSHHSILPDYIEHLLTWLSTNSSLNSSPNSRPLKIVANAGNGAAGHVLKALEKAFNQRQIPIELVLLNAEPDGHFPKGVPNPLLPENRSETAQAVVEHKADFGLAWDGDFDRCFFFDEQGRFIEGYYMVGLLAEACLQGHSRNSGTQQTSGKAKAPKQKIIHDPRLTWNTIDIVNCNQGQAIQSKTGHAFIKERMRKEGALYGGEMSAHHYFKAFGYCDSGMIPWLLITNLLLGQQQNQGNRKDITLSSLVSERMALYPVSGEINLTVSDPAQVLTHIESHYKQEYKQKLTEIDHTDGVSLSFPDWRFNLRMSNTEPVIRLNVESKGDTALMQAKTKEILNLCQSLSQ